MLFAADPPAPGAGPQDARGVPAEDPVTQSKTQPGPPDPETQTAVTPFPAPAPEPARSDSPPRAPEPKPGAEPRDLGDLVDAALDRMERRATGGERPVPMSWPNVSAALGGGLWSGTLVTVVGDTGSGKTQWALQAGLHAAESGVPVCYVSPDAGAGQIVARLVGLKAGRRWSDLFVGKAAGDEVRDLRQAHAEALKGLPFHVVEADSDRSAVPRTREIGEWMRRRHPEETPGTRPFLLILDFVQLLGGAGRDQDDVLEMMAKAAHEARQAARDLDAVLLFVSTTSRETRPDGDESIGIHRDRRVPPTLGRGNPARLILAGREGDVERESDTVLVLAQEPATGPRERGGWHRVWCAVAKNPSGGRAWCALRFDGCRFEVDTDATPPAELLEDDADRTLAEDLERHRRREE
jgi:hypothetical protein